MKLIFKQERKLRIYATLSPAKAGWWKLNDRGPGGRAKRAYPRLLSATATRLFSSRLGEGLRGGACAT